MKVTVKQLGAGVAATVGVLASLVGVLSYIDEKRKDPPPTTNSQLDIREVALFDPAEPLGDFLRKQSLSTKGYTQAELRRRGYSFFVTLRGEGPVGTRLRLRWRLRVEDGDPVPGADYDQIASDFKSSALQQQVKAPVWVPDPLTPGRYEVRFTFERLDSRGKTVGFADEEDSEPFEHELS